VKLQLTNKFLHRVRIHGGEFDSSARAMNRAGEKDTLITYERALEAQADLRKFRGSTIERKHMSTKTTFKRVALVAVAALGLGVLSVAPSSATVNADSLVVSSATATQTTAETATATSATAKLTFLGAALDSMSVTASLVSGPSTSTALPYLQLAETASATIDTKTAVQWTNSAVGFETAPNTASVVTNASGAVAQTSATWKVFLSTNGTAAPSVAGTYVVKLTPANVSTGSLNATAQTITITVSKSTANTATGGTVILNRGETNTATTDAVVTASKEVATTPDAAATLVVALKNSAGGTPTESYTATITGPGTLGGVALANIASSNTSLGRSISVQFNHVVQVFADGSSGVATVTISTASGVVLGTKSITFYGDASTITAKTTALTTGTVAKVGSNAKLISFTVADAAGTSVNTGSYYLVSAAAATISNTYTACNAWNATDGYTCDVAGVAKGTTNVYVTNKPSATDTTVTTVIRSADVAVRVGTTTPAWSVC